MIEFFKTLLDPNMPFLLYAFVAGVLSSISFGMIGAIVVTKRISYIAGAISHCVLGGIGVGLYIQKELGIEYFTPMLGAFISALIAALIIGFVNLYFKEREDTVIGALWSFGMAIGLIFIAKTPGYVDPMSYLFGNILLITKQNIWTIVVLDISVIVLCCLFYQKFLAICFDEEFAKIRGIKTGRYYLLLLCLTAITVVTLVNIVGIVLVIALLTIPAALSNQFTKKLWQMMMFSVLFCILFNVTGISISYSYDLPSGPTIIIFSSLMYFLLFLYKFILSLLKIKN